MRRRVEGATPAGVRAVVRARADAGRRGEMAQFMVRPRGGGQPIGTAGYNRIDLVDKNAEFGLALLPAAWGAGAAAEIHLLGLGWGFETLGLHRIEFVTAAGNARMRAFFDRCGIPLESVKRHATRAGGRWTDLCVYALLARGWPAVRRRLRARLARQAAR